MTATNITKELQALGTESYQRILMNHGAKEPVYGVKIEELKKYQKRIKKDYQLALDLYATGNYDAQYLAGLIADEAKMTKKDLRNWVAKANCNAISGTIVAALTAESRAWLGSRLRVDRLQQRKRRSHRLDDPVRPGVDQARRRSRHC